jgi:hypothetical protein
MVRKHITFDEAREAGKLDRYAKEHPIKADAGRFSRLLGAMAGQKRRSKRGTLGQDASEGSSETQSPQGTSEDA